jgi:glycosyltransferase involved in cell wall biosynthesis
MSHDMHISPFSKLMTIRHSDQIIYIPMSYIAKLLMFIVSCIAFIAITMIIPNPKDSSVPSPAPFVEGVKSGFLPSQKTGFREGEILPVDYSASPTGSASRKTRGQGFPSEFGGLSSGIPKIKLEIPAFYEVLSPTIPYTETEFVNNIYGYEPANRFRKLTRPKLNFSESLITVITTSYHSNEVYLKEVALCLFQQTFSSWEWLIINDGWEDDIGFFDEFLKWTEQKGFREQVRVIHSEHNNGLPSARNFGAQNRSPSSRYLFFCDDDDQLEFTYLEKAFLLLELNKEYVHVNAWSYGFGVKNYTWKKGYESGNFILEENQITVMSMIRAKEFDEVGGFDSELDQGMEDWDLWLRLADQRLGGITIRELLFWYRLKSKRRAWPFIENMTHFENFKRQLKDKYPSLYSLGMPIIEPQRQSDFACGAFSEGKSTKDIQVMQEQILPYYWKRLFLIIPWIVTGGADEFNIQLVHQLTNLGWQITVVQTVYNPSNEWAPRVLYSTDDVWRLPDIAKLYDSFKVLVYLIKTRNPSHVLISNSETGYHFLPKLKNMFPAIRYFDFNHADVPTWKGGGYPRYSIFFSPFIDGHIVASKYLQDWLTTHRIPPVPKDKTKVVYIGVDIKMFSRNKDHRDFWRNRWGIGPDEKVIIFVGRIHKDKEPMNIVKTAEILSETTTFPFRIVVVGDGPMLWEVKREVNNSENIRDKFIWFGSVNRETLPELYSSGDIFFLPSRHEGISLSILEAMATSLSVVSIDRGGQKEICTEEFGILTKENDPEEYADALNELLQSPDKGHLASEFLRKHEEYHSDKIGERIENQLLGELYDSSEEREIDSGFLSDMLCLSYAYISRDCGSLCTLRLMR